MDFPKKGRPTKGLAVLVAVVLCAGVAGCAMSPFGNHELTENTSATSNGAPMPIEATYTQTVAAMPPAPVPATPAAVAQRTDTALTTTAPASGSSSALLSPDEKQKVIAELEALAKKQGAELTAERAKAAAACDNLSADALRKKMLQGEC